MTLLHALPALPALPALVVGGPLAIAGLMLVFSRALPRPVPDLVSLVVALACLAGCLVMAHATEAGPPLVTWFGGWTPRVSSGHAIVLGISFFVDPAAATVAGFAALLFAATLVFAWGYFEQANAHFHVLMLLFMAGLIGFCLTHDLFDLFVWFEVMSVSAFALTGYALRTDALEGALNFTVVNTIGSYLMLGGIGLIYLRLGALDFAALHQGVAGAPHDPAVTTSFALLAAGLLIKGAQVPFQFWLADAHGVAPSPVSVIFSGILVPVAFFGLAHLYWMIYAPSPVIAHIVRTLLLGIGAASAFLGGVMAITQRHIKRMLAFSTIAHAGVMLIGLALLSRDGLAGMLVSIVGHGLVKGAMFMVAGILLALCGGIDEIGLRGRGRAIWPAGIAMAVGGVLLAGLPFGLLAEGTARIEDASRAAHLAWPIAASFVSSAFTGAAVLRVTGRVFLGLGPVPGEEERGPSDDEEERSDRPLWLMMLPTAALLILSLPAAGHAGDLAVTAASRLMNPPTDAVLGLAPLEAVAPAHASPVSPSLLPWAAVLVAILLAAADLSRRHLPRAPVAAVDRLLAPPLDLLRALQSGIVGDYVAWLTVGLACLAGAFALS